MTLEDAEKLAREIDTKKRHKDIAECLRIEAFATLGCIASESTRHAGELAEVLLAVLPVVRAAERMRNAGEACASSSDEDRGRNQMRYSDGCFAVERAIDSIRAALAKEQG